MTPKETLDTLANVEYNNQVTDAFMYLADSGYSTVIEDYAIKAIEAYAKQETEKYIAVLTAIANQTDEMMTWNDAGIRSRDLARKALNLN